MAGVGKGIEVVISFDTTGSMYACLSSVRRKVRDAVRRLFARVPDIRIGIIAHGDYCDRSTTYVTKRLDLSRNESAICEFVMNVEPTGGGDLPECYELVLHEVRDMSWTDANHKVLVLIGDDVPHKPSEVQNALHLNWRDEIGLLTKMGVKVYGLQALNRSHAAPFYREIAERTGGQHLTLDQFEDVISVLMAVCYQQAGPAELSWWEGELSSQGRINRNLDQVFATLSGRKTPSSKYTSRTPGLVPVSAGRFQMLSVDRDQTIRDFVQDNGLIFNPGRGFYEFTKRELIQERKEVVVLDRRTGDMFTGAAARALIGLNPGERKTVRPGELGDYTVFVQSTSYNRKLVGGTKFLYEVDMSR